MAQVVERLPSKCEAQSSNPILSKKKKKKKERKKIHEYLLKWCYTLDLKCFLKVHMLKVSSPAWCDQEVVKCSGGGA
jgi:hypothetical protein